MQRPSSRSRDVETVVERRRTPRAPLVVRVSYGTIDAFFSEFASNVNEGGLFIETDSPPAPDTKVSLHFQLPGSEEPVRTEGRVAWVRDAESNEGPPGMGVQFEHLTPADRQRINDLVRGLRKRSAD